MSVLILAEHDGNQYKSNILNVVTAAQQFSQPIHILVAGKDCNTIATELAKIVGIEQVLVADDACYEHQLAENMAKLLKDLASDYKVLMTAASSFGKNIFPRVAALLDSPQISDITQIIDANTFLRPIYAGNALETVEYQGEKILLTIRSTAFKEATLGDSPVPINVVEHRYEWDKTQFIKCELTQSSRPELTNASIVVSGGRGLQNKDNFKLIEQLADKLGAAIGASRAAVDAGFVPNDYQVGQTGKVVAPELYIAIGISGAIQHVAGIKDSKVIVAINKDEDAPIFEYADYGLVGDLFKIIPELIAELD